jgi:hypothetical protein
VLSLLRAAGLFLLVAPAAAAFSLLGPFEPWMLDRTEYTEVAGGGPVIPEHAYRWNLPVITYGFDPQFRATFGEEGVEAVESAINLLRELPDLGSLDAAKLASFPAVAWGLRYDAMRERLIDLRSTALSALLHNLGLASSERYVFCLAATPPNAEEAEAYVLRRNYEPLTALPSESINGAGFFYSISFLPVSKAASAVEMQNYLLTENPRTATAFNEFLEGISNGRYRFGFFSRGLTRDDVGGLAYLWSTNRIVWEELPPDCHAPQGVDPLVQGARRPGIGRVEWHRHERSADGTGWVPLELDFEDRFLKPEPAVQQVIRKVASPDVVFGVASGLPRTVKPLDSEFSEPFVTVADTSRWICRSTENGRPGEVGPGQITPGARIGFNPGPVLTWQDRRMTDPPKKFPRLAVFDRPGPLTALRSPPLSPDCRFEFLVFLSDGRFHPAGAWTVEARPQGSYRLETSTNLVHWTSSAELSGEGGVHLVLDDAFGTSGARFFRIR